MSKKSKKDTGTEVKKEAKDLKVSKETVQSLSDDELGDVQGGVILPQTQICPKIPPLGTMLKCPRTLDCLRR